MKNNFLELGIIMCVALMISIGTFKVDNSQAAVINEKPSDSVILKLSKNKVYLGNVGLGQKYDIVDVVTPQKSVFDYQHDENYIVRAYSNGYENKEIPEEDIIRSRYSSTQLECMARNIYYESRGEGSEGMTAVAYVTMNRLHSGEYPTSICGVVYQGKRNNKGILYSCQFSWTCDNTIKQIRNKNQWEEAKAIAIKVANGYDTSSDPTNGSLFYHAAFLKNPFKKMKVAKQIKINNHVFYKKV